MAEGLTGQSNIAEVFLFFIKLFLLLYKMVLKNLVENRLGK